MKRTLCLLFLFLSIGACGNKKNVQQGVVNSTQDTTDYISVSGDLIQINFTTKQSNKPHPLLTSDSVFVELPGFGLNSKPLFSIRDSLLLLATSKSDNAYVIDLNDMLKVKDYRMRKALDASKTDDLPACDCTLSIGEDLQAIDFYTDENIILQTQNKLTMINSKNMSIDSLKFNDPEWVYSNVFECPVKYNPVTEKIYIYRYRYNKTGASEYYSFALEASINIPNKKIEDENFRYPEIYSRFNLVTMENFNRTVFENYHYFTFFPDHRLYVYNILNKETSVYGGKSAHSTGEIRTFSKLETNFEKMLSKMLYTDLYMKLEYDEINKRYYRLFLHPTSVNPENGHIKFEFYMQIFGADFSLEDEVQFDKMGPNYFSYGGKLYWVVVKPNGAMFYRYTFK